jgi:hypothetical protein
MTWGVAFKQQVAKDIHKFVSKCNIFFHVVDSPTSKAIINLLAKIGVDDCHGQRRDAL